MAVTIAMPGAFIPNRDESSCSSRPFPSPSFYPSPSPSAASALSNSFQSITRASSSFTINSRKRPRLDINSHTARTPRTHQPLWHESEAPSPAPLVNTDYRLAGGLDTPRAAKAWQEEQHELDHEKDYRANRYSRHSYHTTDSYFPQTPGPNNAHSSNKRLSPSRSGWGRTVWELTGGVAGKVINFCLSTAFHGFHSGGGRGYDMQISTPMVTAADMGYVDTAQDVFDNQYRGRGTTPIPGGFPEEHLIEDYMSHPGSHQDIETPTQRTDPGGSSLRCSWIMVNAPDTDHERSPVRKKIRPSTANIHARSTPRQSLASRPKVHNRNSAGGASFASPRASTASLAADSRPLSSGETERQHKKSHSAIASPRRSGMERTDSTPKSPEVMKFEKRIRRQDQRQDESLKRMNHQMQDMMKEAQQALASSIEVSEEVEDEGYGEGDLPPDSGWSA